jgi:hypothetical protein
VDLYEQEWEQEQELIQASQPAYLILRLFFLSNSFIALRDKRLKHFVRLSWSCSVVATFYQFYY